MTFDESIAWLCAPTLCRQKAGTLFYWRFSGQEALRASLLRVNQSWMGHGLCVIPLTLETRCAIYCFRPALVRAALLQPKARALLQAWGYPPQATLARQLACLRGRMARTNGVPHELGLFLGYPPEDVAAYAQGNQPCLLTGFWRVYHDAEHAAAQFARMRRCMACCRWRWAAGEPLSRLCCEGG